MISKKKYLHNKTYERDCRKSTCYTAKDDLKNVLFILILKWKLVILKNIVY